MAQQPPYPPAFPPPPYPPPGPPAGGPQADHPAAQRRREVAALVVAVGVAVLMVAVAALVPLVLGEDEEPPSLAAVVAMDELSTEHRIGDVDYEQSPTLGGPHDPVWLACGVYDDPVREENVAHDLEHGTVWITHDPDLPASDLERLADRLPGNGIMSPYPGLDAPVVVTVWGRQLRLDGPDEPRLDLFIRTFGAGETAPEPFASCAGGVPVADPGPYDGSGGGSEV
ncbi:DUF3105 domain-containing protein [Nocardioides sp. zg-DK7169]|uniref:DUF3105 domain-containing protein n=1 Tax=Nocardioides sp. zg-DK7169 TaxID=2736600 RepID=UPI001556A5CE|nr:DUF3105 domain-containing protein [Nocardioides sp. zg-DK7169]NPC95202.1 DUF3105 domain-containing protein [Nocardioides sp. zg-DK7169]